VLPTQDGGKRKEAMTVIYDVMLTSNPKSKIRKIMKMKIRNKNK